LAAGLWGQRLDLSSLDRFSSRASESANISLDQNAIGFAAKFLSSKDAKEQATKNLLSSILGIHVRTFEFDKPGEFSQADLEPVRRQLQSPGWSKVIDVKEGKGTSAEVYFFLENGQNRGVAIVAAEEQELAVINIVGPIDPAALAALSGQFGIPNIRSNLSGDKKKPSTKKEDDDE
jgi:hypothetical protein